MWDAIMEEAKPAGGLAFGGAGGVAGGPPSASLRPLALHCAEQWSGRVRPECLEVIHTLMPFRLPVLLSNMVVGCQYWCAAVLCTDYTSQGLDVGFRGCLFVATRRCVSDNII